MLGSLNSLTSSKVAAMMSCPLSLPLPLLPPDLHADYPPVHIGIKARAQALIKQLEETYEQIEQNNLALSTFKFLADQEDLAVPRRLESLNEDVVRQMDREKQLQGKYAFLLAELNELKNTNEPITCDTNGQKTIDEDIDM